MIAMSLPAFADGQQLVFKTTDGSTRSIAATGLDIKFADGNMVATAGSESLTLPVASLSTMEFVAQSSGVAETVAVIDGPVTVTAINGVEYGSFASAEEAADNLIPGVYVLKYESGAITKIIVRK